MYADGRWRSALCRWAAGGDLACLKVQDGEIVWQRSLVDDFGGRVPMWSYRESPLVDGEKVICTPGGEDATLVALDKLTGETIWKSQMPSRCRRLALPRPVRPGPGGSGGRPGRPDRGSRSSRRSAAVVRLRRSPEPRIRACS